LFSQQTYTALSFGLVGNSNFAAAIPYQPDVGAGPSVRFGTNKTGSNTCLSNSLFAWMDTKQVFNRHRHNIPSLLDTRTEGESLKDTMTEFATFYKLAQIHGAQDNVVCDLSSNNLTFDHALHISKWLRENSIKLYALDLSFNRIIQEQWAPVLELIRGLLESAELVKLGGNYLPLMLQDDELQQIQVERRVSLTLPMYSEGYDAWQAGWNQLAEHFDQQTYGLIDESRSEPECSL